MNNVRWSMGLAVLAFCAAESMAQTSIQTAYNYYQDSAPDAPPAPGEPIADPVADDAIASDCNCDDSSSDCASCDSGCGGDCCGCGDDCCGCGDGCCSNGGWGSCFGDCCLGEAWTLHGYMNPCCDSPTYGGWVSLGYHSETTGLSAEHGDLLDFNDVPDRLNFHQVWFYGERKAATDGCSPDWGYRVDVLYGTDAQKTQAFGNSGAPNPEGWDNDWDHGVYGWAIPQLYAELGYNDWSVKVGHFFTPLGYEVIPAPQNFFYSHALTMFNSEPFTHTGVLGTYSGYDDATFYAGWTLGWDTGFDQYEDGNNWLGGVTVKPSDNLSVTYLSTAGNFGFRSGDEAGYSHSIVVIADISCDWQYVFQSDYVHTDGLFGDDSVESEDVGVNQYLFYTLNDCWKVGGRMEWWKSDQVTGESVSFFELTGGINYHASANVVIRPEIRYDWTPSDEAVESAQDRDGDYNRAIFGIDAIFTY